MTINETWAMGVLLVLACSYILGLVIVLWVLWALMRSAVLSALRQHDFDLRQRASGQ
ncbi:hypothetical protein [Plantibacter sp. RU18]|uniref:hypothetical protein n=1 Tax=Plantibacter sp. RU18 TaxID=3158143 RepID=UPI003D35D9DE